LLKPESIDPQNQIKILISIITISLNNIHSLTEFETQCQDIVRTNQFPLVLTITAKAMIDRLRVTEKELQELKFSQLRQELQIGHNS
jgi:hypothetical protein